MKFSIRDILWLTVAVALAVGWWIDRSRLAIPAADYRLWKAEAAQRKAAEAEMRRIIARVMAELQGVGSSPPPYTGLGPDGLRRVPGNKDYQFPPHFDDFIKVLGPSQVPPAQQLGPDGLRLVPGDKDYQFPPNYPLYYRPVKLPSDE
jgi:hypothetical protein